MSALALLVVLLLALVSLLIAGNVTYAVHRHPSLNGPIAAGLATLATLAAASALALSASGR
ncbi:hypothetical protein ACWD4F_23150 [Streptomyces aureus]